MIRVRRPFGFYIIVVKCMHMHVYCFWRYHMRTTIEMKPEHRAKLLELAARRGKKGFSGVVAEAIETYLTQQEAIRERQRKVLKLKGSLSTEEAEKLRGEIEGIRSAWR